MSAFGVALLVTTAAGLATGIGAIMPVKLDNPGVKRFEGKGVYYFARDRAEFHGKRLDEHAQAGLRSRIGAHE